MTVNFDRKKLGRQVLERYADAIDEGASRDEAVARIRSMPSGLPMGNFSVHLGRYLNDGMGRRQAIEAAMTSAFGQDPGQMPTEKQAMVAKLSARYEAELSRTGDPQRAARTAVTALAGKYAGIAHHLAEASGDGMEPAEAAAAAVDRYFTGGGQQYGDAFVEQSGWKAAPAPRDAKRTWDDLASTERTIVAGYMARSGREYEEPKPADIAAAFEALSNQR